MKAAGILITNKKIAFQKAEQAKRASELIIANKELVFQNGEKEKRAAELVIAEIELVFQNKEKGKKAAKLIIANKELAFQNKEKEKRAAELIIANKELAFQNKEKGKKAAKLIIANKELAFQNKEKEKRAAELIIANKELAFQNAEKEKRAEELVVANKELAFQNEEKEKRAAELVIANKELAFQNEEKEKHSAKLVIANKELAQFAYVASHDLQEPLRTISNFVGIIEKKYLGKLDAADDLYLKFIVTATSKMQNLIKDLLDYSRIGRNILFSEIDCNDVLKEIIAEMEVSLKESNAKITFAPLPVLKGNRTELKQLFQNLISNAIKFRRKNITLEIGVTVEDKKSEYLFAFKDNGIGIEKDHIAKLFVIFQRLHNAIEYPGTGIGLATCKKIVMLYNGKIWIKSKIGVGSTFYFSIPKKN